MSGGWVHRAALCAVVGVVAALAAAVLPVSFGGAPDAFGVQGGRIRMWPVPVPSHWPASPDEIQLNTPMAGVLKTYDHRGLLVSVRTTTASFLRGKPARALTVQQIRTGFPFRFSEAVRCVESPAGGGADQLVADAGLAYIGDPLAPRLRYLPTRLAPFQFAASCVAWALVCAAADGVRRFVVRRMRVESSRCPDCGYSLDGVAGVCPECGGGLRSTMSRRTSVRTYGRAHGVRLQDKMTGDLGHPDHPGQAAPPDSQSPR